MKFKNIFGEFAEIYDELEASNTPSIHKIIPIYDIMFENLRPSICESEMTIEDETIELLKRNLLSNVDSHYKTQFRMEYEIATFLDPTFKIIVTKDLTQDILDFAIEHGIAVPEAEVILISIRIVQDRNGAGAQRSG